MNITEVREIIAFAEGIEGRLFPRDADTAWLSVVSSIPIEEARVAAAAHFSESTDHLMPAHITQWRRSWEPTPSDFPVRKSESDGGGFDDLFSRMISPKDPEETRRIRESKFLAEAERLGLNPDQLLIQP